MACDNYDIDDFSQPHSAKLFLVCLTVLLSVAVFHAVLAFGCYFVNELRRLTSFEIAILFLGDIVGLFWFLRFAVRWQSGEMVSRPQPVESRRIPRTVWIMMGTMSLGLLGELAMTHSLRQDEYEGFQRAVPAVCTVDSVQSQFTKGAARYWKLNGQYRDAAGETHPVIFYLRASDELPQLPAPISLAIQQNQMPLELPIVYDPEQPGRSWIPQRGWDDGNRLHYMSLLILFFQFLASCIFLLCLWENIKSRRHLPWWTELHNLIPLGTQAFIMALFGGIELYIVQRFCP